MIYNENDTVYVFNGRKLYNNKLTIQSVSNDEEHFTLTGQDDDGREITVNVLRSHVMDIDESDKLAKLLVNKFAHHIEQASDIDEINDYVSGKDPEHATIFADATLDGIVMDIAGSFSNVFEFQEWFLATFSHYSPNGIYYLNDTYYIVLPN